MKVTKTTRMRDIVIDIDHGSRNPESVEYTAAGRPHRQLPSSSSPGMKEVEQRTTTYLITQTDLAVVI